MKTERRCHRCSTEIERHMFCPSCDVVECLVEFIRAHWSAGEEIRGLLGHVEGKTARHLAETPTTPKYIAGLARQAVNTGASPEQWNKALRRVAAWSDDPKRTVNLSDAGTKTLASVGKEPKQDAADLGMEEPEWVLGMGND